LISEVRVSTSWAARAVQRHDEGHVRTRDAGEEIIDHDFIGKQTSGLKAVRNEVLTQEWADIVEASGVSEEQIHCVAEIYIRSRATMLCYGMGLTQHQEGSRLLQQAVNLLLLLFAAIRMSRATAPLASTKSHPKRISIASARSSASSRRDIPAITRSSPSMQCRTALRRSLSG
jgi:hypothetical protein